DLTAGPTTLLHPLGVLADSVELTNPTTGEAYAVDIDFTIDASAGTVSVVGGGALDHVQTARARYIPRPVSRLSTETNPPVEIDVPSSAAPRPALVLDVVPAVASEVLADTNRITSTRNGRLLRVWLARPWWSTGDGELLGVLTTSDASPDPTTDASPFECTF